MNHSASDLRHSRTLGRVIDEDGSHPRCAECGVLMRDIDGGYECPACGHVYAPTMPIQIPRFNGPSIHGG